MQGWVVLCCVVSQEDCSSRGPYLGMVHLPFGLGGFWSTKARPFCWPCSRSLAIGRCCHHKSKAWVISRMARDVTRQRPPQFFLTSCVQSDALLSETQNIYRSIIFHIKKIMKTNFQHICILMYKNILILNGYILLKYIIKILPQLK